ncbi:septum formation initiator family protein [Paenibacillus pseudetheri]|uniref:Cell division protein FtsL n=1 Tax=Paenibacillus pseudetheri TaxID=2897682 RepID=A0ABN8FE85_9BACL|nr:septum formation initiator family protein [Paenibacillus pseudetheri]CAH1055737.1 Cell division protein FtsL [Paenibacillus pseudetheri]
MAYTRGNLAVQPKRKEEVNPLYREKTKVVTKRRVLPLQEKLLYMLTLGVCVLVAITLISRYVHIYDLNLQAQKLDKDIATAKKQISTFEMEKQSLEQKVAQKAKDLGYVSPDENTTIFIPANPLSTEGDN